MTGPQWRKSSTCDSSSCVEVVFADDLALVRESRNGRYGPQLRFDREEWGAFIEGAKAGEFDWPDERTAHG